MAESGIVRSFMKADPVPDEDLYTNLSRGFKINPDNPAMLDAHVEGRQITYRQLESQSNLIARHLMKYGFNRKSTLVLFSSNSFEYALMAVATLRLGGKFANINNQMTARELHGMINLCDGDFVFSSCDVADKAKEGSKGTLVKAIFVNGTSPGCISMSALLRQSEDLPSLPSISSLNIRPKEDVACILFSSGTTGYPKATMLSHYNMIAGKQAICYPGNSILKEKNLVFVPMFHMYGVILTYYGFGEGRCAILMAAFDPVLFLETIQRHRLTLIQMVPPIAVLLAKHPMIDKYDLRCVETVLCGAAPLSADIEQELCQKLKGPRVRVVQGYGLTEAGGVVTLCYMDDRYRPDGVPASPPGSCGLLSPNWETKIIDIETGATLGPHQDGELLVRSPQIMLGYQKNEAATRDCLDKDGWLHTGDILHYDEHGYFFVVDRLKELIKYKAFQVAPAELEALLLTHPDVADCAVIGLPDTTAGELPHAWVVPKPGAIVTDTQIIKFVEENAAPFKKLRGGVKMVEAIPKSPSGKILRREIRAHLKKAKL